MDPDAALEAIRECLADYRAAEDRDDPEAVTDALARLAEIAEGVDAWIKRGGFLPRDWRKIRTLTEREANRVGRVTWSMSPEAARAGVEWDQLDVLAQRNWAAVASQAISEYLMILDYRLIEFTRTPDAEPGPRR